MLLTNYITSLHSGKSVPLVQATDENIPLVDAIDENIPLVQAADKVYH